MNGKKTIIRLLDKRFAGVDSELLKKPPKGWIRTIREALGMTSTQLARKVNVNMALENQQVDAKAQIDDLAAELLSGPLSDLWED